MKRKLFFALTLVFFCLLALSVSAGNGENSVGAITPDGNLTLIDDIHTENKQFITVQTKNGNYFYIVIDRSDNSENVYFLNTVDEADLRTLLGDDADSILSPDTENETDSVAELPQDNSDGKQKILLRGIVLLVIFGGIGGATYYYIKIKKPKKETDSHEDEDGDQGEDADDETLDAPMAKESDKTENTQEADITDESEEIGDTEDDNGNTETAP